MLYIEPGEKVHLPKEHHKVNNISAFVYDLMTEIFVLDEYKPMQTTSIHFQDDENFQKIFADENIHVLDALKLGNRDEDLEIILAKHIIMSMLSDMVNFIYESISIAKKGKLSVAYALLRKPFTDQLLILEQLLVNRKQFIYSFFHVGDPKIYDPSSKKIEKEDIIKQAVQKVNMIAGLPSDLIYQFRYDKSFKGGINWISNQALHVVTNDKNYATQNQNFNFIFSNKEDTNSYWEHFYSVVPHLLIYTSAVVDKLVFELIEDNRNTKVRKDLKRLIAIMLILNSLNESDGLFKTLGKLMTTECKICKHRNQFTKKFFMLYFEQNIFACKKCYNPLQISDEVYDKLRSVFDRKKESA